MLHIYQNQTPIVEYKIFVQLLQLVSLRNPFHYVVDQEGKVHPMQQEPLSQEKLEVQDEKPKRAASIFLGRLS